MLTYEITAMLCVATFALGMGMGVFAADMMRRTPRMMVTECPTCAERGYDNADYNRLHRLWCKTTAENAKLQAALEKIILDFEGEGNHYEAVITARNGLTSIPSPANGAE